MPHSKRGPLRYLFFIGLPIAAILLILWSAKAGVLPLISPEVGSTGSVVTLSPEADLLTFEQTAPKLTTPSPATSTEPTPSPTKMPDLKILLVQILTILAAASLAGRLMQKIGQPRVVGEMLAGIVLGPSVVGGLFPAFTQFVFPSASLGFLNSLSQVGLVFFMFLVGLEIDPAQLKNKGHTALLTSHASITAPFLLGVILAVFIYRDLAPAGVGFTPFALFLGAAMSVTAFPVLARILAERNLMQTRVGSLAIVCAAVDDVTAWCILAMVVAIASAGSEYTQLAITVAGSIIYCVAMLWVVKPLLLKLDRKDSLQPKLAVVAMVVLLSALITDLLGIHALFGAFLAGAIMPRSEIFVKSLVHRLEDVTVVVLLPIFFAFTGLRTSIALIDGFSLWMICLLIIVVAVLGKLGGSALAARTTGLSWRESGAIGILMNTRGLMELIILNVGLDIGLISPTLFAMMVIMALVTTFMTSPLLSLVYPINKRI